MLTGPTRLHRFRRDAVDARAKAFPRAVSVSVRFPAEYRRARAAVTTRPTLELDQAFLNVGLSRARRASPPVHLVLNVQSVCLTHGGLTSELHTETPHRERKMQTTEIAQAVKQLNCAIF